MASYTNFLGGFNVTTASSIDRRLILSKNEMLTLKYDEPDPKTGKLVSIKVPDFYFALCLDDKKMYFRDKTLAQDAETGTFHPIEDFLNFEASESFKESLDNAVAGAINDEGNVVREAVNTVISNTVMDGQRVE